MGMWGQQFKNGFLELVRLSPSLLSPCVSEGQHETNLGNAVDKWTGWCLDIHSHKKGNRQALLTEE